MTGLGYSIFDTLLDGVVVIDSRLKIVYFNEAFAALCGLPNRRIHAGMDLAQTLRVKQEVFSKIDEITAPTPYEELEFATPGGNSGVVQISIQPKSPDLKVHWVVFLRNVTLEATLQRKYNSEREQKAQAIEVGLRDPHTQLYNKRVFWDRFQTMFKTAKDRNTKFCLIVFDLDKFKVLNDTYGHAAADQVLIDIAAVLRPGLVRSGDVVARFGGEEFVILVPDCDAPTALRISERLRERIQNQVFNYKDKEMRVTVSIGIAEVKPEYKTAQDMFEAADAAAFESKKRGRNTVTVSGFKSVA